MKITSGRCCARERDAFEPAGRGDHLQARAFEQAGEDAAADRAVVDDERGDLLARREPRIERRLRRRLAHRRDRPRPRRTSGSVK